MNTKDKWAVNSANKQEVNSFKGINIADCSISLMISNAEKEANAKLIASAPELLKALKTIKNAFYTDGETDKEKFDDLKAIAENVLIENGF